MPTIQVKERDKFQTQVIYDPANGIVGASDISEEDEEGLDSGDVSKLANGPFLVQVDAIPAGTTAAVEIKIHIEAEWVQAGVDLNSTNTPVVGVFEGARPNYMRVRRKIGDGQFKAYVQV